MPKAIVIGATSGIGRALAVEFARNGYEVGLVGRRERLLDDVKKELSATAYPKVIDITKTQEASALLDELIEEMDGVDVIVINSGILVPEPDWEGVARTIDVNVTGFAAMAEGAMDYFVRRRSGHIVGISSIAALRGARRSSVYNASKAFVSTYLAGLRHRLAALDVDVMVTDIKPGSVATSMIEGRKSLFWVATPETAAKQIFAAIKKRKKHAYVTRRWRLVAWLLKTIPDKIYHRA